MREQVIKILEKALRELDVKMSLEEINNFLESPPNQEMGDLAFPCFQLAQTLRQDPKQIALQIKSKIGKQPLLDFDDVQTAGPYVNFFFNRKEMARSIVWDVITQKDKFGKSNFGNKQKIVLDFSSPNIAKPFGIGHLRTTIIGNALANIAEFVGFKVVRENYLGDWGTQFGKLIFAYEKWGKDEELEKGGIDYLLKLYVKANNKKYEDNAREAFKRLEQKEKSATSIWRAFKELSTDELKKVYDKIGIKFDVYSGESISAKLVPKLIEELNEKKLLKKSEGALIVDLSKYDLGACLIQKTDGTSIYAARDLAMAIKRYEKYGFFSMIYETGQEQTLHFKQIFKVLELMGYDWAKNCIHVSHGLYLGKDGKRLSTRKGKNEYVKDLINETKKLTEKEIVKRFPSLSKVDLDERALKVALAAIFYGDLKNNRTNNMVFDLKKFISFEGDTGPYIEYSYARAGSILRKSKNDPKRKFKIEELEPKEIELIKKLHEFPGLVIQSYHSLNPALIANYSYSLAQIFNEFYHSCPVIDSENESFRLALVEAFRQVLKNSLSLLGISVVEEM